MLTIISIIISQILFILGASVLQHGNYGSHVLIYKDADKNIREANKNTSESTKILVNRQKYCCTRKILLYIGKILLCIKEILLCIRKILLFSAHTYSKLLQDNITKHINTDQRTTFRKKNNEQKHFANKHLISNRIECIKKREAVFLEKIVIKI